MKLITFFLDIKKNKSVHIRISPIRKILLYIAQKIKEINQHGYHSCFKTIIAILLGKGYLYAGSFRVADPDPHFLSKFRSFRGSKVSRGRSQWRRGRSKWRHKRSQWKLVGSKCRLVGSEAGLEKTRVFLKKTQPSGFFLFFFVFFGFFGFFWVFLFFFAQKRGF